MTRIFTPTKGTEPDPDGNCSLCPFRRGMSNPFKGVKLSKQYMGKCIRIDGYCENYQPEKE